MEKRRHCFQSAYGMEESNQTQNVGVFTEESLFTFNEGQVEFKVMIVEGGAHEIGGGRGDFAIEGQYWDFLSRFVRVNGVIQKRTENALSGEF